MPAVRRTRQDPNEAAGLLACTAVMAETIPPCINMIIMGFVANISIAGLFVAGLVPAAVLALALAALAVFVGKTDRPRRSLRAAHAPAALLGGALVALVMIGMIGKGVTSGVATSTEVSAFAVVYALVVGGLAFRELSVGARGSALRAFGRRWPGGILFIVAAASSVSFALTIEQIPQLRLGRDDRVRSPVRQQHVPAPFGGGHDGLRCGPRRRAGTHHLRPVADADRAAARGQSAALRHRDGHRDGAWGCLRHRSALGCSLPVPSPVRAFATWPARC